MALLASLAAVAWRSRREEGRGAVMVVEVVEGRINIVEARPLHLLWAAAAAADGEDDAAAVAMGLERKGLEERKKASVVEGARRKSMAAAVIVAVLVAVRMARPAAPVDVRRLLLPIWCLCGWVVG